MSRVIPALERKISDKLLDAAGAEEFRVASELVDSYEAFDPKDANLSVLLIAASADSALFEAIANKTDFKSVPKETAADLLNTIINYGKNDKARLGIAEFLIREKEFDLNQEAAGATAFNTAAENNDIKAAEMVIECSIARRVGKITGLEDDETARNLIEMIRKNHVGENPQFLRSKLSSRDGSRSIQSFIVSDEFKKFEVDLMRSKIAFDVGRSGGGGVVSSDDYATPQIHSRVVGVSPEGRTTATATPPGEGVRVSPKGVASAVPAKKDCCVIS